MALKTNTIIPWHKSCHVANRCLHVLCFKLLHVLLTMIRLHHKGTYNHFQQVSTLDMHTNHIYTGIVYQSHCTKYFSGHLCT